VRGALVALVGQGNEPCGGQLALDVQIHAEFMSWTEPGSGPDTHRGSPVGSAMTCMFIPWQWCLSEKNGQSAATRSIRISVPSRTANGSPAFTAARTACRSLGARAASSATVSVTYRPAVAVPTSITAASCANGSPLRRWTRTGRALRPGVRLPSQRPDRGPVPADDPGDEGQRLARQRQRGTVEKQLEPLE
jgi:hypothetical protein